MTTTAMTELPEPELGYIETDKSRQPAFSARQMREALQSAQAALEALEEIALAGMSGTGQESEEGLRDWHARQAWKFIGIAARELEPLRRALALRPAAQTEREAFEAWFDDYYDKACAEFGGIDCTDPKGIAEDAWQARASLPAPQQATPERHLTVTTNQQGEAVMVSWQDDEHRILDVVWERKPATPEPVVAESILVQWVLQPKEH